MKTIKSLIIATTMASAFSPVTSLCAMEKASTLLSSLRQTAFAMAMAITGFDGQELRIPRAMEPRNADDNNNQENAAAHASPEQSSLQLRQPRGYAGQAEQEVPFVVRCEQSEPRTMAPRDAAAVAMVPAQATPMTPEEIAEATRIEQFVAKKTKYVYLFLPSDNIVNTVLSYVKPTKDEVFKRIKT